MKLGKFAKGFQKQLLREKTRQRIAANAQKAPTTMPGVEQVIYELPKLNYKPPPTKRLDEHRLRKQPKSTAKPKRIPLTKKQRL